MGRVTERRAVEDRLHPPAQTIADDGIPDGFRDRDPDPKMSRPSAERATNTVPTRRFPRRWTRAKSPRRRSEA